MRTMVLTAIIECPACREEFEGTWHDDSMDPEQRDDNPVEEQSCPCGNKFDAEYEGWGYTSEAG